MPPASHAIINERTSGRANLLQLIQLRWIAIAGQVVTIAFVQFVFLIPLPLPSLLAVLALQLGFNLFSIAWWRTFRRSEQREVSNRDLFLSLLVDVAGLTAQLYLCGGATNPFVFLYLLQVAIGAVMLRARAVWSLIAITSLSFAALTVFHMPLALPLANDDLLSRPYLLGILLCYAISAGLLAVFIARINRDQLAREARLADLRQQATEQEHIVRMGLLASGAAHELSTPLSTLAVILNDWKHMLDEDMDADQIQDINEMQSQVERCKTIVTGILQSAGEARGEAPHQTSLRDFLDALVAEWRATRQVVDLAYENQLPPDLRVIADPVLAQTLHNVLDNALEASPAWVGLTVMCDKDRLTLAVADRGPGFPDDMLAQLGKPYQSSKDRPGRGLGLFLAVNVLRTLGGSVTARNRVEGGALVVLSLPLAAITIAGENA